jgi:electron transfer flavoprotein alpha subunit
MTDRNFDPAYDASSENRSLWVYLERQGDSLAGVSRELLGKARQLADEAEMDLIGLLIGEGLTDVVGEACEYGADIVWSCQHPLLAEFNPQSYSLAAEHAIREGRPSIFLLGATHDGRDLAGRLAVQLQTGLNADCTDLIYNKENGTLVSEVTGFGGGVIALLECPERRPQMSTVRPGVFPPAERDEARPHKQLRIGIELTQETLQTTLLEQETHQGADLTQAEILWCGGRGIEGDFGSLYQLAALLGGDVGATRPPVDDGFIERERQVGQTGVVCRPKVAICFGISGAFHFVVGVEKADLVIAINSDPEAPIFDFADYCIVGDARTILPALIKASESKRETAHA